MVKQPRRRGLRAAPPPPSVEAESPAATHWFMAGVMAVAIAAFVIFLPIQWVFDMNSPDFNPMVLIPVFLGAFGLYHLAHALRWQARARKFGAAALDLAGRGALRAGERLEGVVRTTVPLAPSGDVSVALQCVDVHEFRDLEASSGRTHTPHEAITWEQIVRVPAQGLDSVQGIPFAFDVPDSLGPPPTAAAVPKPTPAPYFSGKAVISIPFMRKRVISSGPPDRRYWRLQVTAPAPGTDFHQSFVVPSESASGS